jgi:1-deoxy-D-xylulose-5-phosphate synthase
VLSVGNNALDIVENIKGITVINARTIKPLDETMLRSLIDAELVITVEDGCEKGGFGESVRSYYSKIDKAPKVICVAHPDKFVASVSKDKILLDAGITEENISNIIKNAL